MQDMTVTVRLTAEDPQDVADYIRIALGTKWDTNPITEVLEVTTV